MVPEPMTDTSDMLAVHQVFRASFASAPELLGSVGDDGARRELIADYFANVLAFLEVHHEAEDALVFPLLAERVPDQAPLLERMRGQHDEAVIRLGVAKDALASWSGPGGGDPAKAVAALVALGDNLRSHLDDEEEHILPLAGEHLSAEEWGALPGHGMAHFTGDKVWLILGLIREGMSEAQRQEMLASMPPPAVEMWRSSGEASFTDMIAAVRRTA